MTVHQCFAMNFRHGTGITHTNPNHGPLSDKVTPPSQFAGYGSVYMYAHFLYLKSQAWPGLNPAPEDHLEDCIDFIAYKDEIQDLETIIRQHLKGTKVVTFSSLYTMLYVSVCGCVCVVLNY